MTTSRFLCPLDCGWHHDQADFDPSRPQPFASQPAPEGVDPDTWGYTLGRMLVVEDVLKEHLQTHGMLTWVEALQAAKQRLVEQAAEHAAYEESVVGALNERNTRDCRRADKAEAQVARIRAFLEDMAGWCSPHGVAADYAQRGLDALDGVDPLGLAGPTREQLAEEQDGADRYADMVNAPLRPETIAAINKRIKAGDLPARKVKPRDAAAEHRWRCDGPGHGPLTSSPHASAEAARRAYERHQASEHRGEQR